MSLVYKLSISCLLALGLRICLIKLLAHLIDLEVGPHLTFLTPDHDLAGNLVVLSIE